MIQIKDFYRSMENPFGGKGLVEIFDWFADDEFCPNIITLADVHIPVGGSIGDHDHVGEVEVYRVLQGRAEYNDNGATRIIEKGDTTLCYEGQTHGVKNVGEDVFIFIAVIIKK